MTDVQNLTDEVSGFSTTVQMLRNEIQEKADGKRWNRACRSFWQSFKNGSAARQG